MKSGVSATDFSTAVFDDSLRFAIIPSSGKVYKYVTNEYVNIFNVTGVKSKVFIYSSPDANRVLIFTYNNTAISQSVPYETAVRIYVSDGTNYNQVTLPNNGDFTTRTYDAKIYFDQLFETIVCGFASGTESEPKVNINVVKVDFSARTVANYEVPQIWYSWINPIFAILGEIIYCMQPIAPGSSQGTEVFFKVDKANLKIVEVTKRPVNSAEWVTFMGGNIVEENGEIFVLYDSEPTGAPVGTVRLIKRGVGSPNLQNRIRDIIPQDAGFLVQNG